MSRYMINKKCDECKKIELPLTEINIGDHKISLCYPCAFEFIDDLISFKGMNWVDKSNENKL